MLISVLAEKVQSGTNTDFNCIFELERFCQRVKQDIEYIRFSFTEYTPHDEEYYLRPLFHLASQRLGHRVIWELNVTELFLRNCALYGHYWGVSVSDSEKQAIITRQPHEVENSPSKLVNERARFYNFTREHGYPLD